MFLEEAFCITISVIFVVIWFLAVVRLIRSSPRSDLTSDSECIDIRRTSSRRSSRYPVFMLTNTTLSLQAGREANRNRQDMVAA